MNSTLKERYYVDGPFISPDDTPEFITRSKREYSRNNFDPILINEDLDRMERAVSRNPRILDGEITTEFDRQIGERHIEVETQIKRLALRYKPDMPEDMPEFKNYNTTYQ